MEPQSFCFESSLLQLNGRLEQMKRCLGKTVCVSVLNRCGTEVKDILVSQERKSIIVKRYIDIRKRINVCIIIA